MRFFWMLILVIIVASSACKKENENEIFIPDGYTLIWNDEFNEDEINLTNWDFQTGDGTDYGLPAGWGNDELQQYTENSDNARIESEDKVSALTIRALDNGMEEFTSAKLVTKEIFDFRFGKVEVKAKMPYGQGLWAAIWMLGANVDEIDWPGCGEIDIIEVLGDNPSRGYSTIHFTNGDKKHEEIQFIRDLSGGDYSDDYHVFGLDWTPDAITFYVDEVQTGQILIEEDMKEFLRSFYLTLNVAVGGYWPGEPDESTVFPQVMSVDYVRVFEKTDFVPPEEPQLVIEEETIGQTIEATLPLHSIKEGFDYLGNIDLVVYGGGGEPLVSASDRALDGDSCVLFDFPGGSWGGAYYELQESRDLSAHSALVFSLRQTGELDDMEIKIESESNAASVFLVDYEGSEVDSGYLEYRIPLEDFSGVDLQQITIPFGMWNPQDSMDEFVTTQVFIDRLYFLD